MIDLTWVEITQTIYVNDWTALNAIENNPGWRLIATGNGEDSITTLTFGWPWPSAEENNETEQ